MLNKKPMILVFAGPNGSGKSTITKYFDTVGTYTNADDIVAATGMSNEEAAAFADKKRYEAIGSKEDFTFETSCLRTTNLIFSEKLKKKAIL